MRIIFLVLSFILLGYTQTMPLYEDSTLANKKYSPKISALLGIQLSLKQQQLNSIKPSNVSLYKNLGITEENLQTQRIFLYFTQFPDPAIIEAVEALGGWINSASWIPPLENHPYGFLQAELPVTMVEPLVNYPQIRRIETAEGLSYPNNDVGTVNMNLDMLRPLGYDGSGVRIAILDSGLDTDHPDIPIPDVAVDYSAYPSTDTNVENTVTGHGTHVTGSVLGQGTQSGGQYQGAVPGAELIFLKIGRDFDGAAVTDATTSAISAATDMYDADIITMSYGGWSTYHDGTSPQAQAVDYAVSQGVTVFISAGNDADNEMHYSGEVTANSTSAPIIVTVNGTFTRHSFNLVWFDGFENTNDLELKFYTNTDPESEIGSTIISSPSESSKGTESEISRTNSYYFSQSVFRLRVINHSSQDQLFHLYYYPTTSSAVAAFTNPNPFYTLGSPATADGAIAVGAHVSRTSWTDYNDDSWTYNYILDAIAPFSSRGPRVDEIRKITLTAPGSVIISARDTDVLTYPDANRDPFVIDNDGINDGNGPADYYVMQGTSMACPLAAGAAAILLQHDPSLSPSQVRDVLINTTTTDGNTGMVPNDTWGYGKLNIEQALESILPGEITRQSISSAGNYIFDGTDVSMNFSVSGVSGNVNVAQILDQPVGGTENVTGILSHVSAIRYWKINTNKTGYTTTISFSYDPSADGIQDENTLLLARRDTDADLWQVYSDITRDPDNNRITANNVTAFSEWSFASEAGDNSLPVSLSQFSGRESNGVVHLQWQTESELENLGFNIYRADADSVNQQDKINIQLIRGAGSSTEQNFYTFRDKSVRVDRTYIYILENVDYSGVTSRSAPIPVAVGSIESFMLMDNYPNPFNNQTTIRFAIPKQTEVEIAIYNLLGEQLRKWKQITPAGYHDIHWDGTNQNGQEISSGIYFYNMKTENYFQTKKLILAK